MSAVAIDRLVAAQQALIDALDCDDLDLIETRVAAMADAVTAIRAVAAWREAADLADRVVAALTLAESARVRANYLSDLNRRRLEMLLNRGRMPRARAYGRDGRLRA